MATDWLNMSQAMHCAERFRFGSFVRYLVSSFCLNLVPMFQGMTAEQVDPSRFERISVARDLVQPMEFDVAPDGSIFLIELSGKLKRIDPSTGNSSVVAELAVTTEQENGLIGLALAPDFSTSGWVYLQYSAPDYPGQRVSRFQFRDGRLDLSSEQKLLQYEEQRRECCHHAGSLEFGPDGCLYIATGDNTNPFQDSDGYAPIDERPGREPWDAQRSSANSRSYNGKVLRVKPEPDGSYSIPPGNLFPDDGSIGHPEIYVMGCRNPWRISLDQHTGFLYWGDVGPDAGQDSPRGPRGYDEINQAKQAGNFGWPYFIADNQAYFRYNFENKEIGLAFSSTSPINESPNNTGVRKLPPAQPAFIYYPGGAFDRFPEVASGGRTSCAGPVYYALDPQQFPNCFPAAYNRTLFAFEWSRNWIMCVHLDEHHNIQRLEQFLPDQKWTRPIQLKFDSAGSLYVLLYGETWGVNPDAELVRLDYIRGNRTPRAKATVDRNFGKEPLQVRLSAKGSTDADSDQLGYHWIISKGETTLASDTTDGLGKESQFTNSTPELSQPKSVDQIYQFDAIEFDFTFDKPGIYKVDLHVHDAVGATGRDQIAIVVGNAPPDVRFLEPAPNSFFQSNQPIDYSLEITDQEDGSSNDEVIQQSDYLSELPPEAVNRTFVQLTPVGLDGKPLAGGAVPTGLRLIRESGCLNCHATNRPLVGPPFVSIADKYRDQGHQVDISVLRVEQGSVGVWGKVPMLPHRQLSRSDIHAMVEYILSLKAESGLPSLNGLNNQFEGTLDADAYLLEASYTDMGVGEIPALTGSSSVLLKSRKLQAEGAIEFLRTSVLESSKAERGKFMGAIQHKAFLKFPSIPLSEVGGIRVSIASAGVGGQIDVRRSSRRGEVLASIHVEPNGDWENFRNLEAQFAGCDGVDDIYLVFVNAENRNGLMNIDWVEFLPKRSLED